MYLYGASGHGKVIAEIAEENNVPIEGFIDSDQSKNKILDYTVIHEIPTKHIDVVISIGQNATRKMIVNNNEQFNYLSLIHPKTTISKRAILDKGSVVMAGASVNSEVKIGKHCIINTNASIDHDCIIDDFAHISPNVALAGNVEVGEGTHVGIGACVIQGVRIGKWCTIGAGAVVIKDIPDYAVVVGNPAKILKYNNI